MTPRTKKSPTKTPKPKSRVVMRTAKARAQHQAVAPEQILGRAMLVNVCIGMWEGRKHDREVTQKVNDDFHASHDAGRYHKHLFGGKVPELSAIITAAAALRGTHYNQTLPWSDSGWRLLPTENYIQYTEAMRKNIARYNAAADAWEVVYSKRITEAKAKLNDMFKAEDYPSASSVRRRYHVSLEFSPLPAGSDFRVALPRLELERVAKDVEERLVKSVKLAMQDAWQRLGDAITDLREKLDDGKYLRDSMIDRLKEIAEVLGRLNLTDDQSLESARKQVLLELTTFDAETLRDDEKVRKQAAASADAILKSMQAVYSPSTDEDEDE